MKPHFKEHLFELIGCSFLLLISAIMPRFGVPSDIAWISGVTSILISLAVAAIKVHITNVVFRQHETYGKAVKLNGLFLDLSGRKLTAAKEEYDKALGNVQKIRKGIITIGTPNYFHEIIEKMKSTPPQYVVHAVNCIDLHRWKEDPQQRLYLKQNILAAQRGVHINRAFIIEKAQFSVEEFDIIDKQMNTENIDVSPVWRDSLHGRQDRLKDWVHFGNSPNDLYVDYPDMNDITRVAYAELILDEAVVANTLENFSILEEYRVSREDLREELKKQGKLS